MRRSKQEILELYQACKAKLGKTPGMRVFCKTAGLTPAEVTYYWAQPKALAMEAGAQPNKLSERLDDREVFRDYATVCLHLSKIPTAGELRIVQRELKTRTHTVHHRDGSIRNFREKFRAFLQASKDEQLRVILGFDGWETSPPAPTVATPPQTGGTGPQLHPFLPGALQYLETLARGELPPFEASSVPASLLFERRTADAFRCLGFRIRQLGQGTGRNTDCIATAPRERVALIIDAKVRANGYVLGTEDRKFLDYAISHGKELQNDGFDSIYLVVVAPSFRESDLTKLGQYVSQTPIRSVVMITAGAIIRIVEDSIRNRSEFSIGELTKQMFGNKIIDK